MALSMLVPVFAALIVLVIIAVAVSVKKATSNEEGNIIIKNVYVYLVLFATLMMTIGGSVGAFTAIADIVAPAPYYQTFENYKQYGDNAGNNHGLTDAELTAQYDALMEEEKARQVNRAKNNLVKSLGWIVIPLPVFVFFQRKLAFKES